MIGTLAVFTGCSFIMGSQFHRRAVKAFTGAQSVYIIMTIYKFVFNNSASQKGQGTAKHYFQSKT